MNNRILFMIINNQVQYLSGSDMDHREWYISLGLDPGNFENIVRGFIMENKIIFFKDSNFNYDEEVINAAKVFAPNIRIGMNNPTLEVYCGIVVNSYGEKWEPVLKINEDELTGVVVVEEEPPKEEKKKEEVGNIESGPIIEFKNDYTDEKFIKRAVIVTGIILILSIISKIILFKQETLLHTNNRMDMLLVFLQVGLLIGTIVGYIQKKSFAKYLGVAASVFLILIFDIFDIILGIVYFLFSVDQSYFPKMYAAFNEIKENVKKIKNK